MGTIEESLVGINDHMTQEGNTIHELINSRGCVKHVQRGRGVYVVPMSPMPNSDQYGKYGSLEIPITHCNPDKSVFLFMCNDDNAYDFVGDTQVYTRLELNSDNITIYAGQRFNDSGVNKFGVYLLWQIIEFY